jgi:hypothetical protein
MTLGVVT